MDDKTPTEPLLSWKIKDVHHQIGHYLQALLAKQGLHFGHPRILFWIKALAGASQKELAERLQVTPASLAVSLKRLERAGFLERSCDESDQRVNKIWLTERGNLAVDSCRRQLKIVNESLLAGFSADEQAQLYAYLERLLNNMAEIPPPVEPDGRTIRTGDHAADEMAP